MAKQALQQRFAAFRQGRRSYVALALASGLVLGFGASVRVADASDAAELKIIIHPSNSARAVDKGFLSGAFLKKVTRWPSGEVIRPLDQRPDTAVRRTFARGILKRTVAAVRSYWQQRIFSGRGVPPPEQRSQIYATDVSSVAIEHAREGVYPEEELASFAKNYYAAGGTADFESYWSRGYGRVSVREGLRANAHFFQHDLGTDYSLGEMHVIFCRNVLIYFGEQLRQRVAALFEDGLARRGFLCLGASEALLQSQRANYEDLSATERIFRRRSTS